MTNLPPDRDPRDPLGMDPLDPAAPRTTYGEPVNVNKVDARSGSRTGLAVAAVTAPLLVFRFTAFSGPTNEVDSNTTATPGTPTEQVVPPVTPTTPAPSGDATPSAPAPASPAPMNQAPSNPAPAEPPAAAPQPSQPTPPAQ